MATLPLIQDQDCPLPLSLREKTKAAPGIPPELRIGALARVTGKSARALRLYEEMGLLQPGTRTAGGFRIYDKAAVDRVFWIADLQDLGFSLQEIRILIEGVAGEDLPRDAMGRLRNLFDDKLAQIRDQMARLSRLERELRSSLGYLQVCGGCDEDISQNASAAPCTTCDEHGEIKAPALVRNAAELAGLAENSNAESRKPKT
jgi:DNA-binding transcriptional MerR regulator